MQKLANHLGGESSKKMDQEGIQMFSVNEVKLFGKQDAKYKRATQCIGNLSNIKIGHQQHLTCDNGGDDIFEASCCCEYYLFVCGYNYRPVNEL